MQVRLFLVFTICYIYAIAQDRIPLVKGWNFKSMKSSTWHPAEIPGTVHTDLFRNKLIPDPFFGSNEKQLQWIENETWEYQCSFVFGEKVSSAAYWLCFDGLDTYAEVFLNNKKILDADNMFRAWEVNISPLLNPGMNVLLVRFSPTALISKTLSEKNGILPGEERVYVRKAQYQFGWDWGPRYVTCGIWRDVYIKKTNLVYPQVLIKEHLHRGGIELVQEPDLKGISFYFRINGKPVFMKGANWIPLDHFVTRVSDEQYRQALIAAKEAIINMLRVWGGGIYEKDIFYGLCDSLGIYVWQDFMFACGMYPGDSAFMQNVIKEAEYQTTRLNEYNCIVLWCGNNEISEGWHNWGWQKQYKISAADSSEIWNNYKKLFEDILPGIVKRNADRPYISTSPKIGWGRSNSLTEGDCHYWGVWWGKEPFEVYQKKIPRFMSEYGFQSMPALSTLLKFTHPGHLHKDSADIRSHQKHPTGFETIDHYMQLYYKPPKDFESYVYLTQLLQADAIRTAVSAHKLAQPYCMGTLVWQWSDTWPVTSWSLIDYFGNKKAAWYELKRCYADSGTKVTPRHSIWSGPPKSWKLRDPKFRILFFVDRQNISIGISCKHAAKSVCLSAGNGIEFEDNFFDLLPGMSKTVKVKHDGHLTAEELISKLKVISLYDTYEK